MKTNSTKSLLRKSPVNLSLSFDPWKKIHPALQLGFHKMNTTLHSFAVIARSINEICLRELVSMVPLQGKLHLAQEPTSALILAEQTVVLLTVAVT